MKKTAAILAFVIAILTAIVAALPLLSGATEPEPQPTREQRIMLAVRAAADTGTLVMPTMPECVADQPTMSVWAVRVDAACERLTIMGTCGTDHADPVIAETVTAYDCASMPAEASVYRLPLGEIYPYCIVGEVLREASEWAPEWDPGEPAICCQPGCVCKPGGRCAHIAVGGIKGYDCGELRKLFPNARCE